MLIERYDLAVYSPPSETGVERFSAIARLSMDITAALPYLNAALPGALYRPEAAVLLWKKDQHPITLYATQIAAGNLADYAEAEQVIAELAGLINRVWDDRAGIAPDRAARRRPPVMSIYRRLPQTNCRQCGEPTCYAFAIKLSTAQRALDDCPPLSAPSAVDELAALRALIAGA